MTSVELLEEIGQVENRLEEISLDANLLTGGKKSFATKLLQDAKYIVRLNGAPLAQNCSFDPIPDPFVDPLPVTLEKRGTIAAANVDLQLYCAEQPFYIQASVSGLLPYSTVGVNVKDDIQTVNTAQTIPLSFNTSSGTFINKVRFFDEIYWVSIPDTDPAGYNCSIVNGQTARLFEGRVGNSNPSVNISCTPINYNVTVSVIKDVNNPDSVDLKKALTVDLWLKDLSGTEQRQGSLQLDTATSTGQVLDLSVSPQPLKLHNEQSYRLDIATPNQPVGPRRTGGRRGAAPGAFR